MTDMQLVFLILAITSICFMVPRFRSDLVAIFSLLALLLAGLLDVQEAFAGFSNNIVIMIAALFVVGEGVFQTGLAQKAGDILVNWTGKSRFRLTIFMIMLVAILSSFISNTGTVAILLPVVVSLCRQMRFHPGRLLMPLAFASSMGGALTIIGTAPNLIAGQILADYGYGRLSFFSFTPIGLVILFVGTAYLWFLGSRWLDKPQEKQAERFESFNGEELLDQYRITPYIHFLKVPKKHTNSGKTLKELQWANRYDVTVLEGFKKEVEGYFGLRRPSRWRRVTAGPGYILEAGDVLIVHSREESIQRLNRETGIRKFKPAAREKFRLEESNMAEVILTPQSRLINNTLDEMHFRDKYGLTVLAFKHRFMEPRYPLPEEKISFGDALLVYGKWKDINVLSKEKSDLIVLRHLEKPSLSQQPLHAFLAGAITLCMILMMVLEWIPIVVTAVIAALLMVITGCIRHMDQAYRSINWQTVILIACMLPIATALEKTGGVAFLSGGLISFLGTFGPMAVLAGLFMVTSLFSQIISNTATAVLLFPVAIMTAQQMGVNPVPMVMAVAYAASMAFATPVATPPNAMVMAAGKYTFLDFVKVGVPLQIIIAIVTVLLLPLFFKF